MEKYCNKNFVAGIIACLLFATIACEKENNPPKDQCVIQSAFYYGIWMDDSIAYTDDETVTLFFENMLSPWQNTYDSCTYLYLVYENGYFYYAFVTENGDNLSRTGQPWQLLDVYDTKEEAVSAAIKKAKEGYEVKVGKVLFRNKWKVCYREKSRCR